MTRATTAATGMAAPHPIAMIDLYRAGGWKGKQLFAGQVRRALLCRSNEPREWEERPVSLRLDKATITKIEADRIYDLILPETENRRR